MAIRILYFYGDDEYAIQRSLHQLRAEFGDATTAELNLTHLDARNASEAEIHQAIHAVPFLAAQRMVWLANPSAAFSSAEAQERLFRLLEGLPDTTLLVLYETTEAKGMERHWLVRWMEKHPTVAKAQAFYLPRPREMPEWIEAEVQRQGGRIESAAAMRLAEMVGADTRQAAQEISKLLAYVGWQRPIRIADVQAVCVVTAEENIFAFVDALAQRDAHRAQRLLHRLLESEDEFALWGMVIRQFRLLLQGREVLEQKGEAAQIAERIGLHPFVAEKIALQARAFSLKSLEGMYERLVEMDEAIKTGLMSLEMALELLVIEWCQAGTASSSR
uniref:DNA polymerase III subunit delta n=1 Tax=uncultured Chloroflexota bacterium TaxID=166587 RepID=H5SES3_9CHLR|nr:DNA polymerase III subunit delta [uncultured Chloroflexota bacterium]BAL56886.1 DNA polymerase III subunit delta [uncultured Chloroflexota bacterium]